MNKKATLYKYAKLYNWLIKEAAKVRDYNYIPKNSIFSADLAKDYWYMRNWIQNNPELTPSEKAQYFTGLNNKMRRNIRDAQLQLRHNNRAAEFRKGLVGWEYDNFQKNINEIKSIAGSTTPGVGRHMGSSLYINNWMAGNNLRDNITTATNAENALGLIAPHIENSQVRRHFETVPIKIERFNADSGTVSDIAAAHYDKNKREIVLGEYSSKNPPHTAIHEGMHGVQYMSPNASNEAKAQYLNYTNNKDKINKLYSYVDANGATVTSPRANATYAVESGANQLANDYTRKATENLPRRMRNTIRRGMATEGAASNARYQQSLGINPNAAVPQEVNPRKFTKAVNAAARMVGVDAKKNLDIAKARRAMAHTSFIDDAIEMLRSSGYEISPELETELRQGYNIERKAMHNASKTVKRQKWLDRVKQNPALLEKAKRLGRFVKIGRYRKMYKILKRILLQSA